MLLSLFLGGVEARALENDIYIMLAPGNISCIALTIACNLLSVYDEMVFVSACLILVHALRRIIFQKMRKKLRFCRVINGNNLIPRFIKHVTERQASDASESVDCYFYCHNKYPPRQR